MKRKDLKNKPLVEAILEAKWALVGPAAPGMQLDPHYRLTLGRFSERVQKDYPAYEQLPTSQIPDAMAAHLVQHRFRVANSAWPLLQLGPGIMTVNDTTTYTWADFQRRCEDAVSRLHDSHPAPADLRIKDLTLRYIDAIPFDFGSADVFDYISQELKVRIALPTNLFEGTGVKGRPAGFSWQASFTNGTPRGMVTLRFSSGQHNGGPALVWETLVQSAGDDMPAMPGGFASWLDQAHTVTDDWFFKLIAGNLERRFSGE